MIRTVKGTQDFQSIPCSQRTEILKTIENIFQQNGGRPYKTPLLEYTDILQKKYGDGEKEIYTVKSREDEDSSSLRYDLTVPLTRYCLQYGIQKARLYQIGSVFRLDTPNISHGRFREFIQCDLDFIGEPEDNMSVEAQILYIGVQICTKLGINYSIHLNFRNVLVKSLMDLGVKTEQINSVCTSLDKLEKIGVEGVRTELENKNIPSSVVSAVLDLSRGLLLTTEKFTKLMTYCQTLGFYSRIMPNIYLARGMDYYTGLIFEFVTDNAELGSIIAGGRYDGLNCTLRESSDSVIVPQIGISVGFDRVYLYLQKQQMLLFVVLPPVNRVYLGRIDQPTKTEATEDIDTDLVAYQLRVWKLLLSVTEVYCSSFSRSISKHLKYAIQNAFTHLAIVGQTELHNNSFSIKNLSTGTQQTISIDVSDMKLRLILGI